MNPKTDIDKRVIEAIERVMIDTNINTDKGISRHLEQNELFYYNIKKGKQSATIQVIGKLSTDYNFSLDWLFFGTEPKTRLAEKKGVEYSQYREKVAKISNVQNQLNSMMGKEKKEDIEEIKKERDLYKAKFEGLQDTLRSLIKEQSKTT